ncbi:modulator of post-segregation killing protein (plasmid) [Escherichia coli]|nr:modulator of post-segregation killing protein [Escherichia coli]
MSSPHQDSLLPRFAQGEEGHETTTKFPCLVCVDRVSHTVDIHLSDTKIAVRDSLQRRTQGGGGFHGFTNPVSSNLEAGAGPPFRADAGLTALKRLY